MIITQTSDFALNAEQLTNKELSFIINHQNHAMYNILYARSPNFKYVYADSNLRASLLIRVQLNLERPMVRNSFDTDVFKWFLTLIVDHGYERWYRLIHYVSDEGKATGVRDIIAIISNHTKFHNLPESPTDIFIFSLRKSDLSL